MSIADKFNKVPSSPQEVEDFWKNYHNLSLPEKKLILPKMLDLIDTCMQIKK